MILQNNRKRKQHSSSGPANSTGTGNTVGPSPSSPASTHTPGDGMNTASSLQHGSTVPKSLMMYGTEGTVGLASSSNLLVWPLQVRCTNYICVCVCAYILSSLAAVDVHN